MEEFDEDLVGGFALADLEGDLGVSSWYLAELGSESAASGGGAERSNSSGYVPAISVRLLSSPGAFAVLSDD